MNEIDPVHTKNSPLVEYALRGLELCWLPEHGRWSHIYHLDGRSHPNESRPESDVFYTLNVLLGLARVTHIPPTVDVVGTFHQNFSLLLTLPVRIYAFGTALWAAAELGIELSGPVLNHIENLLADANRWRHFHAQDLGMMLLGTSAQARQDSAKWLSRSTELFKFLVDRYYAPSGLFYDSEGGLRRRFASFASQTYLTLACYAYGELSGDQSALRLADAATRKLIALQGPNGEWPWFLDAERGSVLDYYEIYSVHQCGMAPAFLEHAEQQGVSGATDALIKGFKWVLGNNEMRVPMLVPDLHMTIRSQVRKGELVTKKRRVLRAIANSLLAQRAKLIGAEKLELRLECRSYELGWILWSFGKRMNLPEVTHHEMFRT